MIAEALVALATLLAVPPSSKPDAVYTEAAELERLSCLEAWEQLCSPFLGYGPTHQVRVSGDRVTVDFFLDAPFVFTVEKRSGSTVDLVLTCDKGTDPCPGKGEKAKLEMRRDGTATIELPDFWHLGDGTHKRKKVELVPFARSSTLHDELERRLVPGGKCEFLHGYQAVGGKRCINKPSSSARSVRPAGRSP